MQCEAATLALGSSGALVELRLTVLLQFGFRVAAATIEHTHTDTNTHSSFLQLKCDRSAILIPVY